MDSIDCGGGRLLDFDGSRRGAKMANDDAEEAREQDGEKFVDPSP